MNLLYNVDEPKDVALALIQKGLKLINEKRFSDAKDLFEESITLYPTAEAYTFQGWMISKDGHFEEAISLCKKAIECDPDYGNAYNDIGSYLIELGDVDGSISWFEKATQSKRYDSKHFPYLNLARVFLKKGDMIKAVENFGKALELNPSSEEAKLLLAELDKDNVEKKDWFMQFYSDN